MTDLFSAMRTVNKIGRYLPALFLLLNLASVVFATAADTPIVSSLKEVCNTARNVLAVGIMIMVILAAVVYAVGQIMGAETRARATVWGTAMMTGALIGIAIYILVPYIVGAIASGKSTPGGGPCEFTLT